MSCLVKSVVTFSVHVMLGEVCGYLICSCHAGCSLWLPSLFRSCWVKSVVTLSVHIMLGEVCGYRSVHVMLGEVCGYLHCSCHVG